jgi:hypothetical protein
MSARPASPSVPSSCGSALLACEAPSGRFDALDQPAPPLVALGPATPREQLPKISDGVKKEPEKPKDACGRGSGRDPEGKCVPLGLRETEFVQRVQIPAGEFVMGALPGDYGGCSRASRRRCSAGRVSRRGTRACRASGSTSTR